MPDYVYYILTIILSIAAFALGLITATKSRQKTLWALFALSILLIKAVLHHKPAWESMLFPWVGYVYFQSYWLFPIGLFFFGLAIPQLPVRWNQGIVLTLTIGFFTISLWHERWMLYPSDDSSTEQADSYHHCKQTTGYTCAPAACVSLLSYWNVKSTEGEMARLCRTGKRGTTLFNIYRGLVVKLKGKYTVKILELDVKEAGKIGKPMIMGTTHATVVRFEKDKVFVDDPLMAKVTVMTREKFTDSHYISKEVVVVLDGKK